MFTPVAVYCGVFSHVAGALASSIRGIGVGLTGVGVNGACEAGARVKLALRLSFSLTTTSIKAVLTLSFFSSIPIFRGASERRECQPLYSQEQWQCS